MARVGPQRHRGWGKLGDLNKVSQYMFIHIYIYIYIHTHMHGYDEGEY